MNQFEVATKLPIPLPPCSFQPPPPQRSSSKRYLKKKDDDPFMIAFKQCTKSSAEGDRLERSGSGFGIKIKKNKSLFS
ncbi:hypothetical protein LIER_26159 [Lithospermum erythrorhizon]|uniref:Uncharacterized protein n=1 Tax=Lithospermum erythrorhizon TaxID=34254 RepID=A0AAV3RBN6_LITER